MNKARNNILNKIRMALATPTPLPFPQAEGRENPVQASSQDFVVDFAEQFSALQGKFIFCLDKNELAQNLQRLCGQNKWTKIYCGEKPLQSLLNPKTLHNDIATCEASVTSCEALVARTGSILLSSAQQGRVPSVYAPVHVCIASTSQLVYDIKDGLTRVKDKYKDALPSLLTLATGPSRTADIEKTLVVGVHGPKEVYCFVVDDGAA
ncbi:LutC/YkgG family protein [Flavisolibacter nicotianae]|uniref:LutC/YkgG family protein n=1 Tax=Flavisolibacter nicotianae TaxID=2364882 RepID=UPI001F089BD5|nr:LUD domain-containing protein [Flavisolibacter nicotianae]